MSRVAFVTGASSGIGKGVANGLADAGFQVAVADLDPAAVEATVIEITEVGGDAAAITIDIRDAESVAAAVALTEERLGPVDVLVNGASWDGRMPFVDTTEDFWQRAVELEFIGTLRVTRAIVPGMIDRGWGRVIDIASDSGRVGFALEAASSGAMGAVIAFGKTLAREVATSGVTVNTVCPGPTDLHRAGPMRRIGEPHDIAAAVMFFASDGASYITGQTLSVSGGLTMA